MPGESESVESLVRCLTPNTIRTVMRLYDHCLGSRKGVGGVPDEDRTWLKFLVEEKHVGFQDLIDGKPGSRVYWLNDSGIEICRHIHRERLEER